MNNNSSGGGAEAGIRGSNVPIQTHQIAQWSGSTATITLANKWVQNCINSHERCKPSTELASSLPSRLLEIKFSKTRHRYCVRLCIANIQPNSKYATLSHVWGNVDFVKLLKSNFASFQKDIPISSLTRTFQDALKLALRFGFHYLWIDSLYIIQDDGDDWLKESALMGNVYGGSSLNIAATGARNGNDGLFFKRDLNLVRTVDLMTQVEDQKNCFGANDSKRDNLRLAWVCVDGSMYRRACRESPLYQRAWTFQERFLSPRTLHFGKPQMILRCHTLINYETFPETRSTNFEEGDTVESQYCTFRRAWSIIVENYSKSQLTISSDKLVAFSGVAKHFANKYKVEYLAGIWKEHLPHALVWSVDDKDGTRPLPLRRPSWSWASRNGPIKYDRIYSFVTTPYDDRPSPWEADVFKVLDVQVRTTTPDLYGHCLGGTMRIECVNLLNGTETSGEVYRHRSSKTVHIGEESFSINYYFDDWRDHHTIYLLKIFSRNKLGNPKPFHEGSSNIQCRPPPFFPPIPGAHDCEEGLIIAPVASKKGVFTRVGIYQVPAYGGTLQGFENLRNKGELSFENKLSLYKGVSGVNKAGHQTYIITLV
ncbi:hypothetical protein BELL_0506g00050 [Botrytis elliptica]|uniref:Heterokaryon incompatibility domain-containing protein n=1 Tax=Botrytis elliptica TaxID=278938 RepID=A0A4Z1JE57_9HELO|nr:hypothetical protein BELL_0506g00050 [Botrytis elliptica]